MDAFEFGLEILDEFLARGALSPPPPQQQQLPPSDLLLLAAPTADAAGALAAAVAGDEDEDEVAAERRVGVAFEGAGEVSSARVLQSPQQPLQPPHTLLLLPQALRELQAPQPPPSSGDEEENDVSGGGGAGSSSSGGGGSDEALERQARRRAIVASSARRHRRRKKSEKIDLREQVARLHAQLDALRSERKTRRATSAAAEWEERAMTQRRKRRQAEQQSDELRRALVRQRAFIANARAIFCSSALLSMELNMWQVLHRYTRLGANPQLRVRDYDAICSDAKLDLALEVIVRETAPLSHGLGLGLPSISTRELATATQQFGATIVTAYAFDTMDTRAVFGAACAAFRDSGREWPQYSPVDADVKVVDVPRGNVHYGVTHIRYRHDAAHSSSSSSSSYYRYSSSDSTGSNSSAVAEVVVESRAISYYRVTESYGMLLWDFVDDDELYPVHPEASMKRDTAGAVLVRREVCPDGVERVVCRSVCTKMHTFGASMSSEDIARFFRSIPSGPDGCGSVVYHAIRDSFRERHVTV